MTWHKRAIVLYAILDVASGVEGYIAMGKLPWLVWNVGFGAIVIAGVALARKRPMVGYGVCALMASLDTLFYGRKLVMGDLGAWPAGVIVVAAVVAFVIAVIGIVRARKANRKASQST